MLPLDFFKDSETLLRLEVFTVYLSLGFRLLTSDLASQLQQLGTWLLLPLRHLLQGTLDMPSALPSWPFCCLFVCFVLFCFQTGFHVTRVGFELACCVVKDDDGLSVLLPLPQVWRLLA